MRCPNCGLINPESAMRCDCGYDFDSKSMKNPYLTVKEREQIKESEKGEYYAAAKIGINKGMMGGVIMIAIGVVMLIAGHIAGVFFYYAPILIGIGAFAFVKGFITGNVSGNK